jgi:dienelactone hydrolase
MRHSVRVLGLSMILLAGWMAGAAAAETLATRLVEPWPALETVAGEITVRPVSFPSSSPFGLTDAGQDEERAPPLVGSGTLFQPAGRTVERVPAVVLLHGSGGVLGARELVYGRQLASLGIAALAVDSFAPRRDMATGFTERLIRVTESMLIADAYAALDYLADQPEVDASRVVLIGFSYGALATLSAAHAQVAEAMNPAGRRFAGHAAYYPPCLVEFENPRTTEAPVLMLLGGRDGVSDPARCGATAEELRRGGSPAELIVYADAVHQWDGNFNGPRPVGRTPAGCRFRVEPDNTIRDALTGLPMDGPLLRRIILTACIAGGEPYLIGRDDSVRVRSNYDLGRFLVRVLGS